MTKLPSMSSRRCRIILLGVALFTGWALAGAAEEPPQSIAPPPANPATPDENPVMLDEPAADPQQQLEALQKANQQLTAQLAEIQKANHQLVTDNVALQDQLKKTKDAAQWVVNRQDQLEATASQRGRELAAAQTDNQQLKASLAAVQSAAADQLKAGTTELAILRVAVAKQTDASQQLQQQLTDAQAQIGKLNEQIKTLQQQPPPQPPSTELEEQLKASTAELAILRIAATKQSDINNSLHQQLTGAKDQIATLTAQVKTLQAQPAPAAAPAPATSAELTQLRQQLDDARKQAAAARAQSDEAGKQLAEANSQLTATHAQLDEAQKQLADANAQLAEAKAAAAATAAAPAAGASELADTQDRLATALRSYSLLEKDNASLKASSHDLAAQISVLEVELAAAHARVNDLGKQLQAASTQAGAAGALRAQLQVTQAQVQSLATENTWLRQQNPAATTPPAGDTAEPTRPVASWPRAYTVAPGDTLAKISQQTYGTPSRWHDIYLANRAQLDRAGALVVGMQLTLP